MCSVYWKWPALCVLCLVCEAGAAAGIRVEMVGHATGKGREFEDYLRDSGSLNEIVRRLTMRFRFPSEVVLRVGTEDGPLYDVASRTIRIPYDLSLVPSPSDRRLDMVERRLLYPGIVAFAVCHEIGHALIQQYHWPVQTATEEEETADALAVYLIANVLDCRDIAVESLAEILRLEGTTATAGSPDACLQPARVGRVFCWFAGTEPEGFDWFWQQDLISGETPETCRSGYRDLTARLEALLKPAERSMTDGPR